MLAGLRPAMREKIGGFFLGCVVCSIGGAFAAMNWSDARPVSFHWVCLWLAIMSGPAYVVVLALSCGDFGSAAFWATPMLVAVFLMAVYFRNGNSALLPGGGL